MAEVSERGLYVAVLLSFAAGVLVGWQANRQRRKYLDWRRKRLHDKLLETQKRLDLS
ncbi:mitoregulin isoform 1-T3 [Anomaloglossus baeobatrachus]|uniref:mitoregulin n=1 Tax=Anomaloglossus baeobatrachus TaxID=238106 RepID=UPI003F4FF2F4